MSKKMKFELNREGVRQLLRSPEVMSVLKKEADARARLAGTGYSVNTFAGKNRGNAEIFAETAEAKRDNFKNNTLERVIS